MRAAWGVGAVALLTWIGEAVLAARFPLQLDYGEGIALQAMDLTQHGASLYRDPATYPWVTIQYTPIYFWCGAALRILMGQGYVAGRLLSTVSAMGCAMLLARAAGRRGGLASVATALALFSTSALVLGWSTMCRVDSLGLLFEISGLYLVDLALQEGDETRANRDLLGAGLAFAAAFWTKQSLVFGAAAGLLATGLWRGAGTAWRLGLTWVLGICLPWLALDASNGHRLYELLFRYNYLPWRAELFFLWAGAWLPTVAVPLLVALTWLFGRTNRDRAGVWGAYLGFGILTLVLGGKEGSFYNHFLPIHAALSVVAAMAFVDVSGLARPTAHPEGQITRLLTATAFLVGIAIAFCMPLPPTLSSVREQLEYDVIPGIRGHLAARMQAADAEIAEYRRLLAERDGPVLAENTGPLVLCGRPPAINDPFQFFRLATKGLWNPHPFEEMVTQHRFVVITLQRLDGSNLRFPLDALSLVTANYHVVGRIGLDFVLLPNPPSSHHHDTGNGPPLEAP